MKLANPQQAVDYVNERGFIFFWPVKGYVFPSLWTAVAGDRPVADEHDDPGNITWNWKDSLLDKKVWYYGRVLKRKNTIISLDAIKYFYALSPNYGEPEEDFADRYSQGLLPWEAKLIFDALVRKVRWIRSRCVKKPGSPVPTPFRHSIARSISCSRSSK